MERFWRTQTASALRIAQNRRCQFMASFTQAQMLGIDHRVGSLKPGKKANIIIIDDMVHVKKVFMEGELAAENETALI